MCQPESETVKFDEIFMWPLFDMKNHYDSFGTNDPGLFSSVEIKDTA